MDWNNHGQRMVANATTFTGSQPLVVYPRSQYCIQSYSTSSLMMVSKISQSVLKTQNSEEYLMSSHKFNIKYLPVNGSEN